MTQLLKKIGVTSLGLLLTLGTAYAHTVGNRNTGYDSDNEASVEVENEADIDLDNDLDLDNDIYGSLVTGYNEADCNTGDGMVRTGDADGRVSVTNRGNRNSVSFKMNGIGGNWEVVNDTTGAHSDNEAEVEIDNDLDVDIDNDADVDNDIDVNVKTGGNSASGNTGDGTVVTGNASLDISVVNDLNNNEVEVN